MKKNEKYISGLDFNKVLQILYILGGIVFLCCLIRGYIIAGHQVQKTRINHDEKTSRSEMVDLNRGWILHHEDGSQEVIDLPYEVKQEEKEVRITKHVRGIFKNGDVIKFDNYRQGVTVSVDDIILYEVNTTSLIEQLSFTDYQLVAIGDTSKSEELSLRFTHTIGDHYLIPTISYGSFQAARNQIIFDDLPTLIMLVILTIFWAVVAMIQIYCYFNKIRDTRLFDLGIFILTATLWGFTDSYLPVLTEIPQEALGILCYLTIMALPIPMCHFIWISCKKQYKAFQIVSFLGTLNLILQGILSSFGVFQLHNTFFTAHLFILVVIVTSLVCIYKSRKKEIDKDIDILYLGILLLAIMALLSMIFYWWKGGLYYRMFMLLGILTFSLLLFSYVIIHYIRKMQKTQMEITEAKIHERLSMFDELTGLPNRRSFENKLQEIEALADTIGDAVLIMLDVNGLKIVNDQYGHSAGDDLIISAARVIQMTYGKEGLCYRIGGDEFVVVLQNYSTSLSIYDQDFDINIENINKNSRWKLSIAKGISHLINSYGQRLTISDWKQEADINMYRNKISMSGSHNRDRAKDLTDIINCIISTVEAKDKYTAAHSERVRELSYCIAKNLGVSDSTIQNLEVAAHLHDIGKIAVPDYILLKPDKLSEVEYEKIKQHCQVGANIIGQAKGMQEIAHIVLHHHERWDGSGYPDGLSKEDIPIESRIIALADSIDAITSKRIYRDSMSLDICRKEIERNSGIMYDPAISRIVLEHWKDIIDIVMMHPKRLISDTSI